MRSANQLRLAQNARNLRRHPAHFRMLQNVSQPLSRQPDLVAKAIGQGVHKA